MTEPLEPLPPQLQELLNDERARPTPRAEVEDRVLSRLELSIAAVAAAAATADAAAHATGHAGDAVSAAAHGAGSALKGTLAAKGWLVSLALVGAGMAAGAGLHAAVAPTEREIQTVERIVEVPVPAPAQPLAAPPSVSVVAPLTASASSSPATESPPTAPPNKPAEAAGARRDAALAEENALIAQAQAALARREPGLAVAALRTHEKKYPQGQLAFERQALLQQALRAVAAASPSPSAPARGTP